MLQFDIFGASWEMIRNLQSNTGLFIVSCMVCSNREDRFLISKIAAVFLRELPLKTANKSKHFIAQQRSPLDCWQNSQAGAASDKKEEENLAYFLVEKLQLLC